MESEEVPPVCCCWSAAKLRPTLGNPMDYGMPGSSVLHYLPELAQTDVHWVGDAIYIILCRSHLLCLQSFPAPGSFPMSWLFASGGQSIGVTASATVLSINIQGWSPLWLTGLISLQSKAQPSLWTNCPICTWLQEKPQLWLDGPLSRKQCLCFFNMLSRFVMSSTGFIKLKINISRLTGTEDEHFYHCYPINMWSWFPKCNTSAKKHCMFKNKYYELWCYFNVYHVG